MVLFESIEDGTSGESDPTIAASNKIEYVKEGQFYEGELKGYGNYYSHWMTDTTTFHSDAKVGFFNEGNYLYGLGLIFRDGTIYTRGSYAGHTDLSWDSKDFPDFLTDVKPAFYTITGPT